MKDFSKDIKSFIKRRKRISSLKKQDIAKNFLPTIQINNYQELKPLIANKKINIEIGFGSGENLAAMAQNNPEQYYLGCEPYYNGIVNLAHKIFDEKLDNIRIYNDDALDLIKEFPDHSINSMYLLFPDPWPKRRHYKRRFVNQANLDLIFKKLIPTGNLYIATDFENYADWIIGKLSNHPNYIWQNSIKSPKQAKDSKPWHDIPEYFTPTKYYKKALEVGSDIYFFNFKTKA